jgi:hypothetical protein
VCSLARRIALMVVLPLAGCGEPSPPAPGVMFPLQAGMGATLKVVVYSAGLRVSEADLAHLVEVSMEAELESRPAIRQVLLENARPSTLMVWHINVRLGRPPATFIIAEMFEGNQRLGSAYVLTSGPDDLAIRSELARAFTSITSRIVRDLQTTEARQTTAGVSG